MSRVCESEEEGGERGTDEGSRLPTSSSLCVCVCVCCICTRVHDTRTSNNEELGEECTETACTRGEREGEDSMENGAKREDAVSCELLLHHHHHAETMKAEWMRKARGR